jgi:hypothetical protein
MQATNEISVKRPVMVRSWGDEPVRLYLHRIENNRCYVGAESAQHPIGLPCEQVFAYDDQQFFHMRAQFDTGDARKLGE